MRFQTLGDKAAFASDHFKNAETVSVPKGTPMVISLNGTDDGLAVVLPSTAGQTKSMRYFAGIAQADLAAGDIGDFVFHGYCRNAVLVRATRAASTDSWASQASINSLNILDIDTVGNGLKTAASSTAFASTDASTLSNYRYYAALLDTLASYASSASATSDTRTALTASVRALLRAL